MGKIRTILPWPGGKGRIAPQIAGLFPSEIRSFSEPFCGGASVSLYLLQRIDRLFLNDTNSEVVRFWEGMTADPSGIADEVLRLVDSHSEDQWYGTSPDDVVGWYYRHLTSYMNLGAPPPITPETKSYGNQLRSIRFRLFRIYGLEFPDVVCSVGDFADVPVADGMFFDPPYLNTTNKYSEDWGRGDADRLIDFMGACSDVGSFVIMAELPGSYYESRLSDWHRLSVFGRAGLGNTGRREERLLMNWEAGQGVLF